MIHSAETQWNLLTLDLQDLEQDEEMLVLIGGRAYMVKPASEASIKEHVEDPNVMSTPSSRLRGGTEDDDE